MEGYILQWMDKAYAKGENSGISNTAEWSKANKNVLSSMHK